MEAARTPVPAGLRYERPGLGRLLKLASEESLVGRVRAGDDGAFAVIYERHFRELLAFCRHMLGSREEAEDVVQQTFISAYLDMLRDDKEIKLRPWLYRIARNHCVSTLRRLRPQAELDGEQASVRGLAEEVSGRRELRALLADLARLPHDQREALVLAELHDNSHEQVAEILGCEREKVKSLVFQARSSLIKSREARELGCDEVRLQLSSLEGSALRRGVLGRHLRHCDGCRAFRADVKRQRQQLAVLLAVVPTAALKLGASTAVAAAATKGAVAAGAQAGGAGIGSAAAGSASCSATATGAGGGSLAALTAKVTTSGMVVKGIATATAAGVLAVGGVAGVERVSETVRHGGGGPAQSAAPRGASGITTDQRRGRSAAPGRRLGGQTPGKHRFGATTPGRGLEPGAAAKTPFSRASHGAAGAEGARPGRRVDGAVPEHRRGSARNELEPRPAVPRREGARERPDARERVPATEPAGALPETPLRDVPNGRSGSSVTP